MRVVDTSAWLEWLSGHALSVAKSAPELPSNDKWIVPTIVQYELTRYLIARGVGGCRRRRDRFFD